MGKRSKKQYYALTEIIERVFAARPRQVEIGMNMIEKVFASAQQKWSEYLKTVTLEDVAEEVMHG